MRQRQSKADTQRERENPAYIRTYLRGTTPYHLKTINEVQLVDPSSSFEVRGAKTDLCEVGHEGPDVQPVGEVVEDGVDARQGRLSEGLAIVHLFAGNTNAGSKNGRHDFGNRLQDR